MTFSLAHLGALLLQYRYWVLFPTAVIEGPIVTILAGVSISLGYMSWLPAFGLLFAGDIVGDVLHYYAGKWGGEPFIRKYGKYMGINSSHTIKLEQIFKDHPGRTILLSKLAHGVGGALLVAAGLVKMPIGEFIYWNVLGTIPKTFGLLALGYYFTNAITRINSVLEVIASVSIILSVIAVFIWIRILQKKIAKE
jgi:membrane-associated protein